MTDTNDLLHQIRTIVREENEPLKQGQKQLEQRQNEQGSTLAQIKTVVEATAAGVKDLQETTAKEADLLDFHSNVGKKIKDHEERIAELEKDADIPHPHKH